MKTFKKILLILFLCFILLYICNLTSIPTSVVILEGEKVNIPTLFGIEISELENVSTIPIESYSEENGSKDSKSINLKENQKTDTYKLSVSFANIKLKNIDVNVIPKTSVVVSGESIGAKLYTNGVLVVGMSEINGRKPYENSGIEEGDMIIEIDKKAITCTADLVESVNDSNRK